MSYFEHVMKQIQQDNEVPQQILTRVEETLDSLSDDKNTSSRQKYRWRQAAAAVAVVVGVGAVVCCSNPALAARIPLIGKIFERVEADVPFAGDYSDKAESLSTAENEQGKTDDSGLTITDAGITVTAQEVYCDGLSVFVTAQVRAEQGGLSRIPASHVVGKDTTVHMLYLDGEWQMAGENAPHILMNNNLEGKVIDDHTFIGMIKLDLDGYHTEQGTLTLKLSNIGWDDTTADNAQDLSADCSTDGEWGFDIPFQVDWESVQEIDIMKESDGYTIQRVFVSPYQVVVYVDTPAVEFEKNITRRDYEEKLGLNAGEEDPDMTYEEYVSEYGRGKQTVPCETVVCNQDGEILPMQDMSTTAGRIVFAVNGKELSTLYIYVWNDGDGHYESDGMFDMAQAAERAAVSAEVRVR